MSAPQRHVEPGLIGELLAEPHRFEFFQAVRLLALAQREAGGAGVRFRNRLSLGFPPSQIDSVGSDAQGIRLTPAFMGLLGGQGSLPLHYSERINRHEKSHSDGGPRAFLDMFSHRALDMFYAAWARHRPECMVTPHGDDAFLRMLTSLSGAPSAVDGDAIDRETLAAYAMQIRARAVSAPLMAGVYAEYFEVPFAVEQLVGEWQDLPDGDQARLGMANVDLGGGVLLGQRLYRCDARVRLRIGPLDREGYDRFLPGNGGALRLAALLALHCGVDMCYEVHLIQRAQDVRGFSLDLANGARLGVDSCLYSQPPGRDREDLMYLLRT
ncbi:type VI secretion system protein ImpH [Duganella sp. CF517]|uniref:type VI secretion system baseplate subunit TssG n=1 Tax=Duganella sp. CF517 TaxID=1881038 RepID=UPI0008CA8F0B|nr:type VI secretion system baseplate subunit TssG [Duganella sp. CF517]SEO57950.1 type VI secretion system protein ImpH [Duganella sp. CF517]